ncbi:pseudaminic acid synthase [candidate division WOR-1 bacterium RIFOXYA12_FULL_52_29]|uniref:Pseudaminic acid synthase n=1 Tax=candidate division WOR-1 bacterium RIFOXYC12_FULL_54_18 TaxID=1802584 RepID=A0A1F4T5N5_UNCSA|nr:MAG: pseudaminic acid synthase [candidate division WOR-1 bacterium RIFOXYA2_FULL_51_19]OGC17459.1 MAG: pseudaminic acid synthase [candidate division WOR-1 bacterium RIFOXYA12_FULL_52_29]OGC26317.1 MAG: pseudaminic acid synthase [candidate division WOR-1 bacterium RIFOXYB2_FULL_45_9]OGC27876.1 MAG: pseudaminic acid synthase [candidate division WOR-1 bacterium RIFOXYC12_FULL_54_18]OGC29836.1 MAG: pseudaminic acid synthase [candidate division WOR-1 bacterium RIFOXYB12_FULL_52_16]
MSLDKFKIGAGHRPFVIAEMSGNHNQSLDRALAIVEAAAKAGAHALKLQTYTADTMTLNLAKGEFFIGDKKSPWYGSSLYDLYQKAATPWEWHKPIFKLCKKLGIIGFSTPFDETAVDFLEELKVPFYKIASFENTDLPLIRKVAKTGKPIILSTGLATFAELKETVQAARRAGCRDLVLLKCTSSYPSSPKNSNILTIPSLRQTFKCQAGISDHTLGLGAAIAAVALGATVIEKHFTLSRADGGVDAAFSLEPAELKQLVEESGRAWEALGKVSYEPTAEEKRSLIYKRSLYVAQDIKAGETFNKQNLRVIRPGYGLAPKFYDGLLGKKVNRDIKKGTPVRREMI